MRNPSQVELDRLPILQARSLFPRVSYALRTAIALAAARFECTAAPGGRGVFLTC